MRPTHLHFLELLKREQPGAQAIINIMIIIGNVVGERRRLRLAAGIAFQFEIVPVIIFADGARQFVFLRAVEQLADDRGGRAA